MHSCNTKSEVRDTIETTVFLPEQPGDRMCRLRYPYTRSRRYADAQHCAIPETAGLGKTELDTLIPLRSEKIRMVHLP